MKILVICQYYYPEPFRVTDICEELVRRGHEVFVVTGEPNYPEGIIYKGYENHQKADEIINGVIIHRCPIIPRKTGVLFRVLNYYSYSFQAQKFIQSLKASDGKTFDVIFSYQLSPIMMAKPAIRYKKRYRIPVVMYCLDLWPESIVAGGITRGSLLYKVFHAVSKRIYKSMDYVFVTSKLFVRYFADRFGMENVEYLPQYAEELFDNIPSKGPGDKIDLVFAGNIGAAQSVDTIIKAAEQLMEEEVFFHIVGSGVELERLMSKAPNNVIFYGRRPLEEMPIFYSMADAMLVTLQSDPVLSLTLPGKMQSYMAAGKPIIGAIDGEAAAVIQDARCGYCGKAEEADELVKNIRRFMDDENRELLGHNARSYYESFFDRKIFMDKLETELKKRCES